MLVDVSGCKSLALVGLVLLLSGCGQTRPLTLSVASESISSPKFVEQKDAVYINNAWVDPDARYDGPIDATLAVTGSAFNALAFPVTFTTEATVRWMTDDRPSKADKMLEDKTSPDNRREGMNKLAEFGFLKNEVFTKRCRQIAVSDTDPIVRATAIRTANRARDIKAIKLFISGLSDPSVFVRLESAKALANIPDVSAIPLLIDTLGNTNENRDVRVAAADALKHYRTLPVGRALSDALNDRSFAISWQSQRSLRYMTDRNFGYDAGAWLAYFTGTEK